MALLVAFIGGRKFSLFKRKGRCQLWFAAIFLAETPAHGSYHATDYNSEAEFKYDIA